MIALCKALQLCLPSSFVFIVSDSSDGCFFGIRYVNSSRSSERNAPGEPMFAGDASKTHSIAVF